MNPNPVFKVRPFFDAKYITNGYGLSAIAKFLLGFLTIANA